MATGKNNYSKSSSSRAKNASGAKRTSGAKYSGKSRASASGTKSAQAAVNFAKKYPIIAIVLVIVIIALAVGGYFIYKNVIKKHDDSGARVIATGDISFHFLSLGNANTGDCIYVKAGDNDILIDGGSRENSEPTIKSYVDAYCTDNKLEYVIVTHAHQDHIAAFAGDGTNKSLFEDYVCDTIIDFAGHNTTSKVYNKYITSRDKEVSNGAKHYTALQCWNNTDGGQRVYNLADSITMEILYNYYYDHSTSNENDYSVCVLFRHGEKSFLFTGDLEEKGEERLVENNVLPEVELFKAGHHGSYTANTDKLLSVIKPKICVVCCCAGNAEYTDVPANQFPSQTFVGNISKYTDKVYVVSIGDTDYTEGGAKFSDLNGNVVVSSDADKVAVNCSKNNTVLKETAWFKAKRTMPPAWAT